MSFLFTAVDSAKPSGPGAAALVSRLANDPLLVQPPQWTIPPRIAIRAQFGGLLLIYLKLAGFPHDVCSEALHHRHPVEVRGYFYHRAQRPFWSSLIDRGDLSINYARRETQKPKMGRPDPHIWKAIAKFCVMKVDGLSLAHNLNRCAHDYLSVGRVISILSALIDYMA